MRERGYSSRDARAYQNRGDPKNIGELCRTSAKPHAFGCTGSREHDDYWVQNALGIRSLSHCLPCRSASRNAQDG
jgi:hypothetical protein